MGVYAGFVCLARNNALPNHPEQRVCRVNEGVAKATVFIRRAMGNARQRRGASARQAARQELLGCLTVLQLNPRCSRD